MVNIVEVDVPEEGMSLDGFGIVLARTKTPERISQQQLKRRRVSVNSGLIP